RDWSSDVCSSDLKFRIVYDTDDPEHSGVFRKIQAEVLVQRVFAALEEAPDKRLVDDGNRLCRFVVSLGEVPSANHTHTEILHIAGAHAIPRRTGLLLDLGWWVPGNKNHLTPVVG